MEKEEIIPSPGAPPVDQDEVLQATDDPPPCSTSTPADQETPLVTGVDTRDSNQNQINNTRYDLLEYLRRLILAAYYEGTDESDAPPFKPKSKQSPF